MNGPPWDQRIARILVKPLVSSPVTPNQLTLFAIAVALAGRVCWILSTRGL